MFQLTELFDLTGKIALVTGLSRGLGYAIAEGLAKAGATIVLNGRNPDRLADTLKIFQDKGYDAHASQFNVTQMSEIKAAVAEIQDSVGTIDILVNNAGIAQRVKAEESSDEDWLNMMNVNLNGVFWCCRAVGRHMLERGQGAIVSIASMSGMIVNKPQEQTAYNVSKAAVIMMTKSLGAEWANRGVRVNCVSPGYIGTDMTMAGMADPELKEVWLEMTPMGHVGEPQDIASAVLYLASDEAKFATGTNLVVDGGYTAW